MDSYMYMHKMQRKAEPQVETFDSGVVSVFAACIDNLADRHNPYTHTCTHTYTHSYIHQYITHHSISNSHTCHEHRLGSTRY